MNNIKSLYSSLGTFKVASKCSTPLTHSIMELKYNSKNLNDKGDYTHTILAIGQPIKRCFMFSSSVSLKIHPFSLMFILLGHVSCRDNLPGHFPKKKFQSVLYSQFPQLFPIFGFEWSFLVGIEANGSGVFFLQIHYQMCL